jgi:hypothetical protein
MIQLDVAATNLGRNQYTVDLYLGHYAVITLDSTGWNLMVYAAGEPPSDRGLFVTPQDAVEALKSDVIRRLAEYANTHLKTKPQIGLHRTANASWQRGR